MKKTRNVIVLATIFFVGATSIIISSCGSSNKSEKMEKEFKEFITSYESKVIPLSKECNLASWNAELTGKEEDFAKVSDLEFKLTKIYTSKEDFEKLKKFKESGLIKDSILSRELDVLYDDYLSNQIDTSKLKKMIDMQNAIALKFNNFRAEVNGKKITDNEVDKILATSTNTNELKAAWEATKKSGKNVSEDVIKLVKLRNEAAKELGFANFHEMSLKLSDQDPKEIEKIFDELDSLTKDAFAELKGEIDDYFAKRYKIKKEELMPWHYQDRFFQEAPKIYEVNLDKYYKGKNLVEVTKKYYAGLGLDISDMVKKSDLYEKEGKNQHAFCTDIDNEGDVRVLCNVVDNYYWMNTLLHEYGHAAYDKYIDRKLPFSLRNPAHTFTTEAIAMMFGRFSSNPQWLKDEMGISEQEKAKIEEICHKTLRLEQLVFSRWAQVMYRFEKSLYENPDQDLNKLWWDLVEKYQLLKRPEGRNEPDWASKIHIAAYPCYYHNYLLGELLASQLYYYITEKVLKSTDYKNQSFAGKKEVGAYLIEKVFKPGAKYQWNDMIQRATGEKLTAKYYAKQFVK